MESGRNPPYWRGDRRRVALRGRAGMRCIGCRACFETRRGEAGSLLRVCEEIGMRSRRGANHLSSSRPTGPRFRAARGQAPTGTQASVTPESASNGNVSAGFSGGPVPRGRWAPAFAGVTANEQHGICSTSQHKSMLLIILKKSASS